VERRLPRALEAQGRVGRCDDVCPAKTDVVHDHPVRLKTLATSVARVAENQRKWIIIFSRRVSPHPDVLFDMQ